jgi:hypothetical protein
MRAADLELLEANAAFYRAFTARNADAMERLWAERHPVACVHPGWDILDERDEIVGSWRAILEGDGAPELTYELAEARQVGDVGVVTCHEVLRDARLAATNVFVREDGAWRMVHHQASPIAPGQARRTAPAGPAN